MKRKLYGIIILFMMLLPIIVHADNVNSVSISGTKETIIGQEFTLTFNLKFKDISANSKGIYAVAFQIDFVDSDFTITGISTDSIWDSLVLKTTDGKYYVVSELNGNTNSNTCFEELFCGTYEAKLTFSTLDTKTTRSTIQVGDYEALVGTNTDSLEEVTSNGLNDTRHVIEIKTSTGITTTTKKSIAQSSNTSSSNIKSKIVNDSKKTTSKTTETTTVETSDRLNNHLKSLKIENYSIDFEKHKNIYTIEVDENINKLKVSAKAEGKNAKVKIIGADNLQENNNKVTIEVTPEKGEKKTYIINVSKIKEKKAKASNNFKLTDDQIELLKYFLIGVLGLAFIIFVIIKIRDRKVEKGIDKL